MCAIPWVSLNSTPNGVYRPCCSPYDFGDVSSLGNIDDGVTYEDVVNHPTNMKIRKAMLEGKRDYLCTRCYLNEDAGNNSLRNNMNKILGGDEFFKKALDNTDENGKISNEHMYLRYWDVRFSNICNFGCRMCSPGNSSFLQIENSKSAKSIYRFDKREVAWNDMIERRINECSIVYFAGGEPMIMKEHWIFLDKLVLLGKFDTILKYNSNMSTLSYGGKNVIDYWKKFKEVKLISSIDDFGVHAEYWRYGTNWSKVKENLHTAESVLGKTVIACAFNMFNATRIREIVKYFNDNFNAVDFDLNYVFTPWFNVQILPKKYRQYVIDELQYVIDHKDEFPNIKYFGRFESAIANIKDIKAFNYVKGRDSSTFLLENRKKMISETLRYDKLRNQDYRTLYPWMEEFFNDENFLIDPEY